MTSSSTRSRGAPRLIRRIAAALALGILAACTGTFEIRPPTLLVVAFEDPQPAVGLVRDTFNALEPGQSRALTFVTGSRRALPARAIDVDVVDRAGTRTAAVFLLRADGTDVAYLRGFDLADIDPDDPTAFAPADAFSVLLANDGPDGDEGILEDPPAPVCPTAVEVTTDGRFAAVFEQRSACGGSEFRAIYILDLDPLITGGEPLLVRSIDAPAPAAPGMYLDQERVLDPDLREALYFVDPLGLVKRYVFETDEVETLDAAGVPGDTDALVDIGRVLDLLVLVADDGYLLIDPTEAAPVAEPVESAEDLTRLVRDPYGVTDEAVLLAGDRLVVHPEVSEAEFREETSAPARTGAVTDPVDRFVYLLGDARIGIYDLLAAEEERLVVTPFAVPEIPSADVMTWTRALLPPPAP